MISIPLTQGKVAIVDDVDEELAAFRWQAFSDHRTTYSIRSVSLPAGGRTTEKLHRAVWRRVHPGKPLPVHLDHVDGNGLNCTRANLRAATASENQHNQRLSARNKSGFKGVSWDRAKSKWHAQIAIFDRKIHLGFFSMSEGAARAYDAAAREFFGAFAALNYPLPGEQGVARLDAEVRS